jgi:hypothetical protein
VSGTSETILVTTPLALSGLDLKQVKPVTRRSCSILSGTEPEKKNASKTLARQINSTLAK